MIHRYVFHNDRVMPIEEVRLSPGQTGLLNGWGLFTTLKIIDGVAFAFERHWHRLEKDAARTRCPFPYQADKVRALLGDVLRANDVKQGCARIYVVNNATSFWASEERFPSSDLIIYSGGLPRFHEPARLGLRPNGRHAASPLAGVKVTSWLNNVWHLAEAVNEGFDEVVLLNERGEVAECTAANVFCVKAGKMATPPLNSGCLEGITRQVLMEIGASAGVTVEERTLFPEDLYSAEEVFISSSNRNLIGVSEIAGYKFVSPGPVTQKLDRVLGDYVTKYVAAHSAEVTARRD